AHRRTAAPASADAARDRRGRAAPRRGSALAHAPRVRALHTDPRGRTTARRVQANPSRARLHVGARTGAAQRRARACRASARARGPPDVRGRSARRADAPHAARRAPDAQEGLTSMRLLLLITSLALLVGCGEDAPATEIRASGHVEATEIRLAPTVGGRIEALPVTEGDRVEAGALIVQIETRDFVLARERAEAEQRQAEAQVRLLEAGARSEDIAQAEAQAQAARDELAAARAELEAAEADFARFDA